MALRLDSGTMCNLELEHCTRQSWKVPGKELACIAEEPEVEVGLRGRWGGGPLGAPCNCFLPRC